jgi:hypothetical protein
MGMGHRLSVSDQDAPAFAGTSQLHTESSPNNSRDATGKCNRKYIHNGPTQGIACVMDPARPTTKPGDLTEPRTLS